MLTKVREVFNREHLSEGRMKGVSFAVIKKENDFLYNTTMPLSACKDYFNDYIFVENTGKPIGEVYGFDHKPIGIFKDTEFVDLLVGMLPVPFNQGRQQL